MTRTKKLAATVSDIVQEIVGEELAGVGYYTDEETGVIYERDDIRDEYARDDVEEILDSARLESLGKGAYEIPHEEQLTATIRTYESIANVILPVSELNGVVIAVDYPGDCSYQAVLQTISERIDSDELGVDVMQLP